MKDWRITLTLGIVLLLILAAWFVVVGTSLREGGRADITSPQSERAKSSASTKHESTPKSDASHPSAPEAALRIAVQDEAGQPVMGASARLALLRAQPPSATTMPAWEALTDAAGQALVRLDRSATAARELIVLADGFAEHRELLPPEALPATLLVVLTRLPAAAPESPSGVAIHGLIERLDGRPLPEGLRIAYSRYRPNQTYSATPDSDGSYHIPDTLPGAYRVEIFGMLSHVHGEIDPRFSEPIHGPCKDGTFHVPEKVESVTHHIRVAIGEIRIYVVDADGQPFGTPGQVGQYLAHSRFMRGPDAIAHYLPLDENGYAVVPYWVQLDVPGTRSLAVRADRLADGRPWPFDNEPMGQLRYNLPREHPPTTMELRLPRNPEHQGPAELRIELRDANSHELSELQLNIRLEAIDPGWRDHRYFRLPRQGTTHVQGMRIGRYSLQANALGPFPFDSHRLVDPPAEITLQSGTQYLVLYARVVSPTE